MVEIRMTYSGDLHCTAQHGPSNVELETDAPVDNQGRGEAFSPTDLCATALATCMLTVMGIEARNRGGLAIEGATCRIVKHMSPAPPRKIERLESEIIFPQALSEDDRNALENRALNCPVMLSLHPDMIKTVSFHWPDA